MVLSIPFALSQTRKAIPAGRYEVLSGIKSSHASKIGESGAAKDTLGLFFAEVVKNIPQGKAENLFFSTQNSIDPSLRSLLTSKGAIESKVLDPKVNIVLSDNLVRDLEIIKKLKTKGSLIVLKDKQSIKHVMNTCQNCEVMIYQSESDENYFLLKMK